MAGIPRRDVSIQSSVLRFVATTAAVLIIMAVVLLLGRLAGGVYWVAAIAFCVVAYVAIMASGAVFRQKLARWRSQRSQGRNISSEPDNEVP